MSPTGKIKAKSRRYLGDTMILQTCFETADGRVSVTDFMPIRGQAPDIVRIVEGRSEEHNVRTPVTNAHLVCRLPLEKQNHISNHYHNLQSPFRRLIYNNKTHY